MFIGKLDRIVDIEQFTLAANDYSTKRTKTWSTYKSGVPAMKDYTPKSNEETVEARQQVSVQDVRWLLRYDSGLNSRMRIKYNNQYFYFKGTPKEVGRGRGSMVITELRDNE